MTLRKVQDGSKGTVVIYHAASAVDEALRKAAPGFTIYNETFEPFKKLYDNPSSVAGLPRPLYLVGFSEGCQGVRAQLRRQANPAGVVAADGIHASTEATTSPAVYQAQIAPWVMYVTDAVDGKVVCSISRTSIETSGYLSTTQTSRLYLPPDLKEVGNTSDGGAIYREGNFTFLAYPGKDAKAHSQQLLSVLPRMLGDMLGNVQTIEPEGGTQVVPNPPASKPAPKPIPKPAPKPEPTSQPQEASAGGTLLASLCLTLIGIWKGRRKS